MSKNVVIDCDICGKDLDKSDQFFMSSLLFAYNETCSIEKLNKKSGKKEPHRYIAKLNQGDYQFCDKCSPGIMGCISEYFKKHSKKVNK